MLTDNINKLIENLTEPYLIVTVGNSFRSDDGVGSFIYAVLKDEANINIIDAGITPENIIETVVEFSPKSILFIDAANFNGNPGEVREIDISMIEEYTISTHSFPLSLIASLIKSEINSEIYFIGIQLKSVEFGEGLSPEIEKSAIMVIDAFKKKEK